MFKGFSDATTDFLWNIRFNNEREWFNDHKQGMIDQMTSLANEGYLAGFVGMLTDSRSFLSYPRHEYFRRTLCNLLGNDVEQGLLPASELEFIGKMVEDICYNNAKNYFKF